MPFILRNNNYIRFGRSRFFHGLRKQASSFKEMIRLALTNATPAQLLTEAATNRRNSCIPDTQTMAYISRAAFEIEDFWKIVRILRERLSRFNKKHWIRSYKALIVLEHLLIHGPKSTAREFQSDKDVIEKLGRFQFNDKMGFNWGPRVREKSERILQLLGNEMFLKEERNLALKIAYGIEDSGSVCQQTSASLENETQDESYSKSCRKHDAGSDNYIQQKDSFSSIKDKDGLIQDKGQQTEIPLTWEKFDDAGSHKKIKSAWSAIKYNASHNGPWNAEANTTLTNDITEFGEWDNEQREPLLGSQED